MHLDPFLLQVLACPICRSELKAVPEGAKEAKGLYCQACSLVFPVRDGIPVLLKEEGLGPDSWQAKHGGKH